MMNSEEKIFSVMHRFALEASAYAVSEQKRMQAHLKEDDSYVTNVDLHISELAVSLFSEILPDSQIISEEHLGSFWQLANSGDYNPENEPELVVMVDPIDGTRNFVHQMPLFGISVGVLRKRRPWLGIVAFPALDELFSCDGSAVRIVKKFSTPHPVEQTVPPGPITMDHNSIFLSSHSFIKNHDWDHSVCQLSVLGCATLELCWPAAHRAAGCVFSAGIWDLAGSWPIVEHSGMSLRRISDGTRIDRFNWDDFDPDTMKMREPVIACHEDHFRRLSEGVRRRDKK